MDAIAKTAWYCCGVRAFDARSKRPVCNDTLAERFMDAEGQSVFARFEHMKGPNMSNAARHRLIDDWLRGELAGNAKLQVVLVGAGFDTRAFRLTGGRWFELDQPALIARKESVLPERSAPNPLERISIDFSRERLADKLPPPVPGEPTVVVMEGVSMYLSRSDWQSTTAALRERYPGHKLVCDLSSELFMRKYGGPIREAIRELGGEFGDLFEDPAEFVESLGYEYRDDRSIAGRAIEHQESRFASWLLNRVFQSLRDGYRVYEFAAKV